MKIVEKSSFDKEQFLEDNGVACIYCGSNKSNFIVGVADKSLSDFVLSRLESLDTSNSNDLTMLRQCEDCGSYFHVSSHLTCYFPYELLDFEDFDGTPGEFSQPFIAITYQGALKSVNLPAIYKTIQTYSSLNKEELNEVKNFFKEFELCCNMHLEYSSFFLARKLIEILVNDIMRSNKVKVRDTASLGEKIDILKKKGILTEDLITDMNLIRLVGNDRVHEIDTEFESIDPKVLRNIIREIVSKVYAPKISEERFRSIIKTTRRRNDMSFYNHKDIEPKWQEFWAKNHTFKTGTDAEKPNFYALDMFPYPSGAGLHVGHPEGYTATDILSRYKRAQGYNVLHPMGWDAFGLPAEQYAMDTGNDPADFTAENIANFKRQINALGFSYDWDREVNTTDPNYYKWTQWIFTKLYEKGLAYEAEVPVNWVEELGTAIANEEVLPDGTSERGGYPVVRKPMRQWMLKITAYAERLLNDLEEVDWPESIKDMQRNWIGKSTGANVTFKIKDIDKDFTVFTTRPDTLFGATYAVLAPEHDLVDSITSAEQAEAVAEYKRQASLKSDLARTDLAKDKTGVWTGAYAINPVNGKEIPIWIADYVLASYGTGAIMAVPAHDERDWEFAKQFNLDIIPVLEGGNVEEAPYTEDGAHINSDFLDGFNKEEAIAKMVAWLEENGVGQEKISYRLRDWLFSRQRYWGEPIPIIHWEDGTSTAVPENELPLVLPKTSDIKPSGTGESPLANLTDWLEVVREDGVKGRRETNTMPQWAGSSWYYLRYIDPHNDEKLADEELLKAWLPVDIYIGGAEHAVLHLLYARFWHKFLYDLGVVPTKEPFQKLFNQGMILGTSYRDSRGALVATDKVEKRDGSFFHIETGEELEQAPAKMSKSLKNVVNPDDVVEQFGADTLRVYEMFMGPLDASIAWSEEGLEGSRKFLDRVYRLLTTKELVAENSGALDKVYNETVKTVTEHIEDLKFNTAIAQLMIFVNAANKEDQLYVDYAKGFVQLIAPFAPHLAEELWQGLEATGQSISYVAWPVYDESKLVESEVEIVVQIKGKVKARLTVAKDLAPAELEKVALADEKVQAEIAGQTVVKVISVPNKLVNIVTK